MNRKHMKVLFGLAVAALFIVATSPGAFAADIVMTADLAPYAKVIFAFGAMLGAGIATVGVAGAGAGLGNAASGACSAVGRNPGAQGKILMTMLVGMAMCEAAAIYALIIALVLLFANPFTSIFLG